MVGLQISHGTIYISLIQNFFHIAIKNLCSVEKVFIESNKKSLTIPKGKSEAVVRRKTDNLMAIEKGLKDKIWLTKYYSEN